MWVQCPDSLNRRVTAATTLIYCLLHAVLPLSSSVTYLTASLHRLALSALAWGRSRRSTGEASRQSCADPRTTSTSSPSASQSQR
ncbi:hypothetical protein EYF80_021946 [Liparis tanakae]|uniref:Uncharacterized protein n=1 Tax=Liparis tanakae TaxID=230148 RepID=A0A4Z2HSJ0_9TELE|nr:hypothetical protein EYF80_021946 [Liparis tanakae]